MARSDTVTYLSLFFIGTALMVLGFIQATGNLELVGGPVRLSIVTGALLLIIAALIKRISELEARIDGIMDGLKGEA